MSNLYFDESELLHHRHVADIIEIGVRTRCGNELCTDNLNVESHIDYLTGHLVLQLRLLLVSLEKTETTNKSDSFTMEFPLTWWDHFKMRYFPKWKRNMQTRYYTLNTNQVTKTTKLCPHLMVDPKNEHLSWLTYDTIKGEK
jgi:hypothetical protein